ncbi:hypothetical protein E1293_04330 [Actinomadura darangshiensis]|uniref:Htaa domain protein n=1 Tax=Actinomadura darangshiensis TaxID=705336 RepID=A0A4R5BRH4_9ACTN|nr:hypothetical protein [Actinomadura darangshiensis]TDD89591.1 hypothetical protein E1293_04330 [Actinomadura darangshiensis]
MTFSLAAVPADAAVPPRIRAVRVLTPGATTKIEVAAYAATDITKVRAVVYAYSHGSPQTLSVDDFELVEGTAVDGVWRTKSAVTVEQGRWMMDVELTTADETKLWPQRATIDNGLDTVIDGFAVNPDIVDVDNPDVTFSGRLMSRTADGDLAPVQGATLRLYGASGSTPTAVTGADGRVQGTAKFLWSGNAKLSYGGDFLHRPSSSAELPVLKRRLQTRVTLSMPDRLIVGDQVTVSGRLEREDRNGVWAPVAGKRLVLQFDPATGGDWRTVATPLTDASGAYSTQVTVTENGAWSVQFANDPSGQPDDYRSYGSSEAHTSVRMVAYRTSITGGNAGPEPVGRGNLVTGYGRVMNKLADGRWVGAPANATVQLQFSTDRKKWSAKGLVNVDGDGTFNVQGRADRDGYWRLVVPRGDYAEPSVSGTDYIDVRYRTKILDFNAAPEPVKKGGTVTVMGSLYRETDKWKTYASKTIKFYFLPKGSSTWTYLGSQKTDGLGRFRKGFKASKDGTWRAYSGAATSYIKTYRDDYVDVR